MEPHRTGGGEASQRASFQEHAAACLPDPELALTLLRVLRVGPPDGLPLSARQLARLEPLRRGRLGPPLAWSILRRAQAGEADPVWAECLRNSLLNNLTLARDLSLIARRLRKAGIPNIVLKGLPLAIELYDQVGARWIHDLDILVSGETVTKVPELIGGLGFTASRHYDVSTELAFSHHLPPFVHDVSKSMVEIHAAVGGARATLDPHQVESLWNRTRTFDLMGTEKVEILGLEDLLVYLCLHGAQQHLFELGLAPVLDIAWLLARHQGDLDWTEVAERSVEWSCTRGLGVSLGLADRLLGAPVPWDQLSRLDLSLPADEILVLAARVACLVSLQERTRRRASLPLQQLMARGSLLDRWRLLRRSVFRPPAVDSRQYGPGFGSYSRTRQHWIRVADLLKQYLPVVLRQRIRAERELAAARVRVAEWLSAAE